MGQWLSHFHYRRILTYINTLLASCIPTREYHSQRPWYKRISTCSKLHMPFQSRCYATWPGLSCCLWVKSSSHMMVPVTSVVSLLVLPRFIRHEWLSAHTLPIAAAHHASLVWCALEKSVFHNMAWAWFDSVSVKNTLVRYVKLMSAQKSNNLYIYCWCGSDIEPSVLLLLSTTH